MDDSALGLDQHRGERRRAARGSASGAATPVGTANSAQARGRLFSRAAVGLLGLAILCSGSLLAVGPKDPATAADALTAPWAPLARPAASLTGPSVRDRTLRVGSWNVSSVTGDAKIGDGQTSAERKRWKVREPEVVRQIVAARLAVLGLQEVDACQCKRWRFAHGDTQFRDLRNSLNRAGVRYALTSNRVHGSRNNRILYKPRLLRLVKQGSINFRYHDPRYGQKGMNWAVFEIRATGRRFLFTNTHLQVGPGSLGLEWRDFRYQVRKLQRSRPHRPVVAVGDYNLSSCSSRKDDAAMKQMGIPSVLDGTFCSFVKKAPLRAKTWTNLGLGSYNAYTRSLRYKRNCRPIDEPGPTPCIGNSIDRMYVSRSIAVQHYEVRARLNADKTALEGVIPSDHYLVTSTLLMP